MSQVQEQALLIAVEALVRISLGKFTKRIDERGLLIIESPRDIADQALFTLQAINNGRA